MSSAVFKSIPSSDVRCTPFKVHKRFIFDTPKKAIDEGILFEKAHKPRFQEYLGNKPTYSDSFDTDPYPPGKLSSLENPVDYLNENTGVRATALWCKLRNTYYDKNYYDSFCTRTEMEKTMDIQMSVIQIPQALYGEGIKPGTVKLTHRFESGSLSQSKAYGDDDGSMIITDDGNGNLVCNRVRPFLSGSVMALTFEDILYEDTYKKEIDTHNLAYYNTIVTHQSCSFSNGVKNDVQTYASGHFASFGCIGCYFDKPNSALRISNRFDKQFSLTNDYTFSFNFRIDIVPPVGEETPILSKIEHEEGSELKLERRSGKWVRSKRASNRYPLLLTYGYDYDALKPYIRLSCSDGTQVYTDVTTNTFFVESSIHLCVVKTNTTISLVMNGRERASIEVPDLSISNEADIIFGAYDDKEVQGKFSIDDVILFDRALSFTGNSEISQLFPSMRTNPANRRTVGSVFYEHGLIVINSPSPYFSSTDNLDNGEASSLIHMMNPLLSSTPINDFTPNYEDGEVYQIEFCSTLTLYEREIVCKINPDEFNYSQNPTLVDKNGDRKTSLTHMNEFMPYMTTIGLYNDKGQLLAIGKLGRPIKKRDDILLNVCVRFDI